jgi:hypothetical protein
MMKIDRKRTRRTLDAAPAAIERSAGGEGR